MRARRGPAHLIAAAQTLIADEVTRTAVRAFVDAGIEVILLRGPSISRHLYGPRDVREYTDADLLVAPASMEAAKRILEEQGFVQIGEQLPDDRPAWAHIYLREKDGGNVDLHHTLAGVNAEPRLVWTALAAHTEPIEVAGEEVAGLDAAATALVVALHAAQHGSGAAKQLDELARALGRFTAAQWEAASALVEQVGAAGAFAAGLRLLPEGAQLADRLGIPHEIRTDVLLRAGGSPPLALGFDWLSTTEGLAPKLRLVVAKLAPSPSAVRAWAPFARRGPFHLLAAYAWRPLWLAWHVVPGYRAWRNASRRSRADVGRFSHPACRRGRGRRGGK